jgi:hypothetical protein
MGANRVGHETLALPAETVDLQFHDVARGEVGEAPGERRVAAGEQLQGPGAGRRGGPPPTGASSTSTPRASACSRTGATTAGELLVMSIHTDPGSVLRAVTPSSTISSDATSRIRSTRSLLRRWTGSRRFPVFALAAVTL